MDSFETNSIPEYGGPVVDSRRNRYTIRATYTLPDGGIATAIHVFTFVNNDTCSWKSVSREIDGELQPDTDEVVLVRKSAELKPDGAQ